MACQAGGFQATWKKESHRAAGIVLSRHMEASKRGAKEELTATVEYSPAILWRRRKNCTSKQGRSVACEGVGCGT